MSERIEPPGMNAPVMTARGPIVAGPEGFLQLNRMLREAGYKQYQDPFASADASFQKRIGERDAPLYFITARTWDFGKYGPREWVGVQFEADLYVERARLLRITTGREYDVDEAEALIRRTYDAIKAIPDPLNQTEA